MIVGLTGGMGCGKSTAAAVFESSGFIRVDSDAIIREQVLVSEPVVGAIRGRYGDQVLSKDGSVNRSSLGKIVFSNDKERLWLEELTHPILFEIQRSLLRGQPGRDWVFEVPLLFEKGLENWFDFTVCIACDYSLQLARLEQRGLDRGLAGQRISTQLPLSRKIELSDFVLWNAGSTAFLKDQINSLIDSLRGRGAPTFLPTDVPPTQDRR